MSGPQRLPVPPDWEPFISHLINHLRAAGHTAQTIETRTTQARMIARHLPAPPSQDDWLSWSSQQNWSTETRRSVTACLRRLSQINGWTDPTAGIPSPKPRIPCPRPCPDTAIHEALQTADARTALILRLAAECGLRRAEIAAMRHQDVQDTPTGPVALIHGKGDRDRLVPLPTSLADAIRAQRQASPWVFEGPSGHLTPRTVGKIAARALPATWTLHTLRHRFGTTAYAGSRDLLAVQQLLGHASPTTTRVYVALPNDALRETAAHATLRWP